MNDWNIFFYSFMIGAALLLSVVGLLFTAVVPGIKRWDKHFFLGYFSILMLCALVGLIQMFTLPYPVPIALENFLTYIGSLLITLLLPMLTAYLLHCCGERMHGSRLLRAAFGLWVVFTGLLTTTLFSDAFYYTTPDKQVLRGPWFPVLMLPMAAMMLLNLAGAIRRRKRLSRKAWLSFCIALLPMTVALLVHIFIDIYPLIEICSVLSALSMYSLILSDQIEQDQRRQREITRQQWEIAHQRTSIMVLQMRPHFIYNTMTSIYCLCNENPRQARQVVMDFTTYLRKNFTAIASADSIPFSSELEHTRAYLAVEQAQYEDSLYVDYDTPHTMFRVPPLTLQPIVENAVKHGRDPYAGPFHISIKTRKTESGSEITVSDDGRGFQPADDSGPHIALKNIRQRLEIMCGGRLTIAPNDGGGTVVTVTIPDGAAE